MAEHSLNEVLEIINQQVKSQELLREYLSKATSLIRMALEGDFLAHPALIVYHYLWALDDFVEKAREACESALEHLKDFI